MKKSEIMLENILKDSKLPDKKIKNALFTLNYLKHFKPDAEHGAFYWTCLSPKDLIKYVVGDSFWKFYYDVLDRKMSQETRTEAERLMPEYIKYSKRRMYEQIYIEEPENRLKREQFRKGDEEIRAIKYAIKSDLNSIVKTYINKIKLLVSG